MTGYFPVAIKPLEPECKQKRKTKWDSHDKLVLWVFVAIIVLAIAAGLMLRHMGFRILG